jgi:hypothetical protein
MRRENGRHEGLAGRCWAPGSVSNTIFPMSKLLIAFSYIKPVLRYPVLVKFCMENPNCFVGPLDGSCPGPLDRLRGVISPGCIEVLFVKVTVFILLLFATLPECSQNQTAVSDTLRLLSDF